VRLLTIRNDDRRPRSASGARAYRKKYATVCMSDIDADHARASEHIGARNATPGASIAAVA
jgi:hypothetical protein